jgi:hypothetical protein
MGFTWRRSSRVIARFPRIPDQRSPGPKRCRDGCGSERFSEHGLGPTTLEDPFRGQIVPQLQGWFPRCRRYAKIGYEYRLLRDSRARDAASEFDWPARVTTLQCVVRKSRPVSAGRGSCGVGSVMWDLVGPFRVRERLSRARPASRLQPLRDWTDLLVGPSGTPLFSLRRELGGVLLGHRIAVRLIAIVCKTWAVASVIGVESRSHAQIPKIRGPAGVAGSRPAL